MSNRQTQLLREAEENKNIGLRYMTLDAVRAEEGESSEEESRRFTVSFSSEDPYLRWFGLEILDHSDGALDMTRLNDIGVLLFNHNTDKVVGKIIRAWVENSRGCAEVEFDTDDYAELIYQKVKSGTLRATSVRYSVDIWEEIKDGKTSKDGKYKGPCWVARSWTPLEVSIVSVPADATVGVGRQHAPTPEPEEPANNKQAKRGRSINELQLSLNKSSY